METSIVLNGTSKDRIWIPQMAPPSENSKKKQMPMENLKKYLFLLTKSGPFANQFMEIAAANLVNKFS